MSDQLAASLAATVRSTRESRGLTISALAHRSGVSRTMIGKIEDGAVQPTAALLGRLSASLGLTLSELIARAEQPGGRLVRAADQLRWTDPVSGYRRRAVSPASGGALELVEIELPPHTRVEFAADTYTISHHQIWVLAGRLVFVEGAVEHDLASGDCLELGPPSDCAYVNRTARPCRYLVALARRR